MRMAINIGIPGGNGVVAAPTPSDLSAGAGLRFWSFAHADNVILSGSDVTQFTDLSGLNNHYTGATPDPQWNATGWSDGSPTIDLDGSGRCFENNNYDSSGNNRWQVVVGNITNTALGFIHSVGASRGGFGWGQASAYFVFDWNGGTAAYRTVGTVTTGEQRLLWIVNTAGAFGAHASTPNGVVYKNGASLGALSGDYVDMSPLTGGYPVMGANTVAGAVDPIVRVKAVAEGEGAISEADFNVLEAWASSF